MPRVRHLANAPIREAVLDLRVELPAEFSASAFRVLRSELESTYPKLREGSKVETSFRLDRSGALAASETTGLGLHSVLFLSEDERTIAQFRADGFTFNKLRPYTEWDTIFPEAMRLWQLYARVANPSVIGRMALRYINEFELPARIARIDAFLTSSIPHPRGAPGQTRGFLSRVSTEDRNEGFTAVVTHSVNERTQSATAVVLDIDVACLVRNSQSPDIAGVFGRLRNAKNLIFFESLSDAAIQLFE